MDWYEKANELYDNAKYEEVIIIIEPKANNGDALAQNYMGHLYKEGKGFDSNIDKAKEWFSKAANQSNKIAQHNLADIYYDEKNNEEAEKLYKLSADQGFIQSCYKYAWMARTKNKTDEQLKYLELASEGGHYEATGMLYVLYKGNKEVDEDIEKRDYFFEKLLHAKKNSYTDENYFNSTQVMIARIFLTDGNKKEGLKRLKKLHDNSVIEAIRMLGFIYLNGDFEIDKDFKKAHRLLLKCAEEFNDSLSQRIIGTHHWFGKSGYEKNWIEAYYWLTKSYKNDENEDAKSLIQEIESQLSSEKISKAKEYIKLKKELQLNEKKLDEMFNL